MAAYNTTTSSALHQEAYHTQASSSVGSPTTCSSTGYDASAGSQDDTTSDVPTQQTYRTSQSHLQSVSILISFFRQPRKPQAREHQKSRRNTRQQVRPITTRHRITSPPLKSGVRVACRNYTRNRHNDFSTKRNDGLPL